MKPEGICPTSGKIGYPNQGCAETMLSYFNDTHMDRSLIAAYECAECGNWHLTSTPQAAWVIEHRPSRFKRFCDRLRRSFEVWPA